MNNELSTAFLRLVTIMDELREKCPWDRKQTVQSLRQMTIEETYELADAITETDWKGIREELGDLLLHIIFYAKIGSEQKQFELLDVINGISEKLVVRHPHIYGEVQVNDEEDVKKNWEKLKLKEGKTSILAGVPKSLPAMVKAMRLQEKAKQVGFEWENKEQVWEKVEEETRELKAAIDSHQSAVSSQQSAVSSQQPAIGSQQSSVNNQLSTADCQLPTAEALQAAIEEEFGDLVFSLINYARFLQVDAENALERTNKKFIHRFTQMEQQAMQSGKDLHQMSLQEMDAIWNTIKQQRPA
jgi:MazG family protein